MTDSGNHNVTNVTPSELARAGDLFGSFAERLRGVTDFVNSGLGPLAVRWGRDATGVEFTGKVRETADATAEAVNSAADTLAAADVGSTKAADLFLKSEEVNTELASHLHR
jgi:hypothetical protein